MNVKLTKEQKIKVTNPHDIFLIIQQILMRENKIGEVPIIDHLIISETEYFSFSESGLLAELRQSKKYVTPYKQEEDRLKDKGKKEKAIEMAKAMKHKGIELSIIEEISGLSNKEIEEL